MDLNIPETYYFETEYTIYNNTEVMDLFLNHHLDVDIEVVTEYSTCIKFLYKNKYYVAYATVGWGYKNHRVEFEELESE